MMSLSTGIKSLEARIKRVEAAAGKGQRHCARCRLHKRHIWPDPNRSRPQPDDILKAKCVLCSSEYPINLAGTSKEKREALRLYFSFTLEDQYTNPKAHALVLWFKYGLKVKKRRKHLARAKAKNDPKAHALAQLREEVASLLAQKHKRLRAKYGESPFPEQKQLIESVQNREHKKRDLDVYVGGLYELEQEETGHLICAELEKIIWGDIRPETATAIERIRREMDELIITTREAAERRKEEARLKGLEFLNKNRALVGLTPLPDDYGKDN